jgi:proton-translocating NADH-quinone oxidoreductase chain M
MTLLEVLIISPLILGSYIFVLPRKYVVHMKVASLYGFFSIFIGSLLLWTKFDGGTSGFQFTSDRLLLQSFNLYYSLGIDGISLFLMILTGVLFPLCVLCSWTTIKYRVKEFLVLLCFLEFMLFNVFSVLDLLLFYIFFESVLIPMFLIIGIWGSRERRIHAAYQFFLYTLIGSLLMLLAILLVYFQTGTTNIHGLYNSEFSTYRELIIWFAFFFSFAVKVPMVPVHIWLPEAHVEAPTAGSVILAGILLKMGTYGLIRFSLPMMPMATTYFAPLVYMLSIISIIYSSCTTIRQVDLKKIIAYSSVAHMNFVTIGIMANDVQGIEGSMYMMLGHGVVSSGLFLCVGMLYERYHTRTINYYGGLVYGMPLFAVVFLIFTLANISFPGTSNFVGEFLILMGTFTRSIFVTFLASIGVILGAVYAIWLYNRVMFGEVKEGMMIGFCDINRREFWTYLPLIVMVFVMGIYPSMFLDPMHMSVVNILSYRY